LKDTLAIMSIRLKPDGTVEFDTADELIAYQHASRNGTASPAKKASRNRHIIGDDEPLPESALKLVKFLLPKSDGVNTSEMAKALGLNEAKGIGGWVTSLTSWGRRHNLSKKQLLVKTRRANGHGHNARFMALHESFRKLIKEGKVPGVKLDN
jgi:hypothetical protein